MAREKSPAVQPPPNHHPGRPVEAAFRIGNPGLTEEVYVEDKRLVWWMSDPEIERVTGPLAEWISLPHGFDDEGFGYIEVPEGTRSVSTVLSGLEAWEGQKSNILGYLGGYQQAVRRLTGKVDVGVSFDTVGVIKSGGVFIVPPHDLTDNASHVDTWVQSQIDDLGKILVAEPSRDELVGLYAGMLEEARNGQIT